MTRPITASFAYVEPDELEGDWRLSVTKNEKVRLTFEEVKKSRTDALKEQQEELFSFKGLSLSFLNDFWKNVRQQNLFPNLELFILKKDFEGIERGTTLVKVDGISGTAMVKHPRTGQVITVTKEEARIKRRKIWTLQDLYDFAILPKVSKSQLPFSLGVGESKQGPPFTGTLVVCTNDTPFEELLLSLRDNVKDSGRTPAEVSYFWINIFQVNPVIFETPPEESPKDSFLKSYEKFMKSAIQCFDERFIYFSSWTRPNILSELNSIWVLNEIFESQLSFEILPERSISSKFVVLYDTDEDLIFENLKRIDPTGLKHTHSTVSKYFCDILTSKPEGFLSVVNCIHEAFTRWAVTEVEDDVKKIPDMKDEATMESFAKFLYKSGSFMRRHGEVSVARSYFKRALDNYANLLLHFEEINRRRGEFDDITVSEQLTMDKVYGGICKIHIYQGLIFIEEQQLRRARNEFKAAEGMATKIVTQKARFLYAVSEARVQLYRLTNDLDASLHELESMALQLRDTKTKTSKLTFANVKYQQAAIYNLKKDFPKARALLTEAVNTITAEFGEESLELGKYLVELGKVSFREKMPDATLDYFEQALQLYDKTLGTVNEHVAHIYHKIGHTHASKKSQDDIQVALRYIRMSIETYELCHGPYSLDVVELLTAEAFLLKKLEDYDTGEDVCMRALLALDEERNLREQQKQKLSLEDLKNRDSKRAVIYSTLGQIQESTHKYFKAKKTYQKAYDLSRETLGENSQQTKRRKVRWEQAKAAATIAMNLKNKT